MLLIRNIGKLITPEGSSPRCGKAQGEVRVYENAAVLVDDTILGIYENGELPHAPAYEIDAGGGVVTPGLVDCHTHLVFGGWRERDLAKTIRGVSYQEILASGGGILDTVRSTRAADEEKLYERSKAFLEEMALLGVTCCEVKSGYGLDLDNELKQLRVIKRLNDTQPVEVVSTFMGAHAVPPEYAGNGDAYVDFLIDTLLPAVAEGGLAEFCDVFTDTGVFSAAQSRRLMEAAKKLGFRLKIHADEIDAIGGSELAGEMGAVSAEHLIVIDEKGLGALAAAGTVAELLPATSQYLGKPFAPARAMIERGIPVAIGTDFNPGSCPSLNLQLAMSLACNKYRMTPEEILTAVTLNAAVALGHAETKGSIEVGKDADLAIWDADDLDNICYRFGSNLVTKVINGGKIIRRKHEPYEFEF